MKGSRSRRSAERLDIAAAFEALKAMWKVEADAPITRERFPKETDAWSHIRARACQLARTHGAKRFLDEIRAEIESNERRPPSRRLTLEALLERLIRKEH